MAQRQGPVFALIVAVILGAAGGAAAQGNPTGTISGHVVDGRGTQIFTHVEVNGQVVYDTPGQSHRSDLWTCTIDELTGVIAQVALTPRG